MEVREDSEKVCAHMDDYWAVKRGGEVICHGPKQTMPNAQERKLLREGGHKIYVEGKLYREGKC